MNPPKGRGAPQSKSICLQAADKVSDTSLAAVLKKLAASELMASAWPTLDAIDAAEAGYSRRFLLFTASLPGLWTLLSKSPAQIQAKQMRSLSVSLASAAEKLRKSEAALVKWTGVEAEAAKKRLSFENYLASPDRNSTEEPLSDEVRNLLLDLYAEPAVDVRTLIGSLVSDLQLASKVCEPDSWPFWVRLSPRNINSPDAQSHFFLRCLYHHLHVTLGAPNHELVSDTASALLGKAIDGQSARRHWRTLKADARKPKAVVARYK